MQIEPPKDKSIVGKAISSGQAIIANDLEVRAAIIPRLTP